MDTLSRSRLATAAMAAISLALPLAPTGKAQPPSKVPEAPPGPMSVIDNKAVALLEQVEARLKTLKTVETEWEFTSSLKASPHWSARKTTEQISARLMKPGLWQITSKNILSEPTADDPSIEMLWDTSDGKTQTRLMQDHAYVTGKSNPSATNWITPLRGFFPGNTGPATMAVNRRRLGDKVSVLHPYWEKQIWKGKPYEVVRIHIVPAGKNAETRLERILDLYIGTDHLIHRLVEAPPTDNRLGISTQEWSLHRVTINPTLAAQSLTLPLPADAHPYQTPARNVLLVAGMEAPDFTVSDASGNPVKLSDFRGKVVLLDFWATWCKPCLASMPHTAALAKKMADQDVIVLAVNVWDSQDRFVQWLPQHPEYNLFRFAIDPREGGASPEQGIAHNLYHVSGIPTQYVIDRQGKIVTHFIGFDETHTALLEKALKKAAQSKAPSL